MNRNVVLFDMDGTLTEARKPFANVLSSPLKQLAQVADVGVVTGSDYELMKEQMGAVMSDNSIRYSLHILPCNGTQYYKPPEFPSDGFVLSSSASMVETLGRAKWRRIMEILVNLQLNATEFDIPLTGNFIAARGSMINWCPIGRSANDNERKKFKKFDKNYNFRTQFFMKLRLLLDSSDMQNVIVKLGGDTSFDIYPNGWDKTYALRYFENSTVWFVGDRAQTPKGNDYEIFKACEPRSYHTTGPEQTKEIIEEIITRIREGK